ncbi:hypothetical protein IDM40_14295 [Nocardiopsis sp. HNM0947]|uniref:Uncharacterized protein n=1 Tax=Nocardiopsis coralli TaxID=2772213 RepID=A0ABR9P7S6_9ACTN|nr:hypothetical protein [Nocardiopsis coralli]MBE2999867.1 hypothetical protein [Nocardiopsis coralli]
MSDETVLLGDPGDVVEALSTHDLTSPERESFPPVQASRTLSEILVHHDHP